MNRVRAAFLCVLAGTTAASAAMADESLSAAEARGKLIYSSGETQSGRVIRAELQVGGPKSSASTLACTQCHGEGGEGIGVVVPNIRGEVLFDPAGHEHERRRHGPFDDVSVARAIREGIDAAGNKLEATMPRYSITDADMADLVAYLKRVGTELDPGLSATSIRVGTILPTHGSLAVVGNAMRKLLEAQFAEANAKGGVHGRRLELVVGEYGADDTPAFWAARDLVMEERPFAVIASFLPGFEAELSELVKDERVPHVGPYSMTTKAAGGEFEFFTQPSIVEQASALIQSATAHTAAEKVTVIYPQLKSFDHFAEAIVAQGNDADAARTLPYELSGLDAEQLVASLRSFGTEAIVFLGSPPLFLAVANAADEAGWHPALLAPARFAEAVVFDLPEAFDGRVYLAYPALPDDYTEQGVIDFELLHKKYGLDFAESLAQVAAFSAARVLIEGLERAGPRPSRESLVETLEGMQDFEPGLGPEVSFGETRRIGVLGAHVLRLDLSKGWLDAEKQWIDLAKAAQ